MLAAARPSFKAKVVTRRRSASDLSGLSAVATTPSPLTATRSVRASEPLASVTTGTVSRAASPIPHGQWRSLRIRASCDRVECPAPPLQGQWSAAIRPTSPTTAPQIPPSLGSPHSCCLGQGGQKAGRLAPDGSESSRRPALLELNIPLRERASAPIQSSSFARNRGARATG
jgi:hypothetical protein